ADKDGVRIAELTEETYKDLLWQHTPITDFWQIAGGISGKLAKYGIRTMGDIAETSVKDEEFLYRLFGINAELLIDHAWGIEPCTMKDIKNYSTGARSISNGQVLPRAYKYAESLLAVKEQAELISLQLVKEEVTADSLTMYIGYEVCSDSYTGAFHYDWYGRKVPAHSVGTFRFGTDTNYAGQIMPAAAALFQRIVRPGLLIRRIFLTANDIKPESSTCYQMDLFHDTAELEKEKNLQKAVLSVKAKYGANAILRGMSLQKGARTMERNTQIGGHRA
ncbi:MAG: DNA methylase, partial [Eubacterium sp.]|nr:DNA methylase [Eubacterium sp.]